MMADKESDNQDEVSTTANATSQDAEPSCSGDWYEEEGEPISAMGMSLDHNAAAEEEQLSATVENTVRSHIANSAARRKAYQQERMQRAVQHGPQPSCAEVSSPPLDGGATVAVESAGDGTQSHECEKRFASREAHSDYGFDSDVQSFADIEFGLFDDLIY
ncbi:unnamed protein product [Angiostrongylus costaricensis]|uniref:BZIP domain-containing protein n=1 Tax=Angiostrongylus costaricensis TaxID=334426 RepID=A0A0R3PX65_ANGCS|nr:unnamed protein product [Angiostrongylus costaricensis]